MKHKNLIVTILVFCICVLAFPTTAFCGNRTSQIRYYEDGTYSVTILETYSPLISTYDTTTRTGRAKTTLYSEAGDSLFAVIVNGLFTYTGVASYCRESSVSTEFYSDDWKYVSSNAYKSANKAAADATGRCYFVGVPMGNATINVTLECDKDGNLTAY